MAGRSDCTLGPSPVSGSCPLTHGTENAMDPEIKSGREFSITGAATREAEVVLGLPDGARAIVRADGSGAKETVFLPEFQNKAQFGDAGRIRAAARLHSSPRHALFDALDAEIRTSSRHLSEFDETDPDLRQLYTVGERYDAMASCKLPLLKADFTADESDAFSPVRTSSVTMFDRHVTHVTTADECCAGATTAHNCRPIAMTTD